MYYKMKHPVLHMWQIFPQFGTKKHCLAYLFLINFNFIVFFSALISYLKSILKNLRIKLERKMQM